MKEHDLQNLIRLELSKHGIITFRINVGKVRMADGRFFDTGLPKGFSDLIALNNNGKVYFLEIKGDGGRASKEQINFIKQMKSRGFGAGIVYTVDEAKKICEVK